MAAPNVSGGLSREDHRRLLQTVFFTPDTDASFIRSLVEKLPNRLEEYPEYLAWAILANKPDVTAFLLSDGAPLNPPLELNSDTYGVSAETTAVLKAYRRTPFIVLAATVGSEEIIQQLLDRGANIAEYGYVGVSKSKRNAVTSNVLGAAVFSNCLSLVEWLLGKFPAAELGLEFPASEERLVGKSLSKEYSGCTPLLLSLHRCDTPLPFCALLAHGANPRAEDWQQNTALHLAAASHCTEAVREILKVEQSLRGKRNGKGETPGSIAKEKGFQDILELLTPTSDDQSAREAEELLRLLGQEEPKKKPKKPKKKKAAVSTSAPLSIPAFETTVQELVDLSSSISPLNSLLSTLSPFTAVQISELPRLQSALTFALASVNSALKPS